MPREEQHAEAVAAADLQTVDRHVLLAGVGVAAGLILLPQFFSVTQQEDIIAGHSFPTYLSKKRGVFDMPYMHIPPHANP